MCAKIPIVCRSVYPSDHPPSLALINILGWSCNLFIPLRFTINCSGTKCIVFIICLHRRIKNFPYIVPHGEMSFEENFIMENDCILSDEALSS